MARSKADGFRRIRYWRQRVEKSGVARFDSLPDAPDYLADLDRQPFHQPSNQQLRRRAEQ